MRRVGEESSQQRVGALVVRVGGRISRQSDVQWEQRISGLQQEHAQAAAATPCFLLTFFPLDGPDPPSPLGTGGRHSWERGRPPDKSQ